LRNIGGDSISCADPEEGAFQSSTHTPSCVEVGLSFFLASGIAGRSPIRNSLFENKMHKKPAIAFKAMAGEVGVAGR